MSNNKYKTLVSNTMLISLGTFGSKLLVFFMVRFYTSYLTPADYGTADLITQTANLLFPLISLGITDGVFRFAVDHTEQRRNIFSVGVYTILAGAVLLVAILPLLGLFPQFDGFLWLIALYTMCSCFHSLCAQFVRAEGHTALYAVQGMINTVLVIGLNVLFLVGLRMGITGYVLSVALADLACTLLLFVRERLWRQLMLCPGQLHPQPPPRLKAHVRGKQVQHILGCVPGGKRGFIEILTHKSSSFLVELAPFYRKPWKMSTQRNWNGTAVPVLPLSG